MDRSTTPRSKLVVAHAERRAQRALQRLVGASLSQVEVFGDLDALLDAVDERTIAVVDVALARTRPALVERPARAWIAVPGEGMTPADAEAVEVLLTAGWRHVVTHPMPVLADELLATVQKLIRGDAFGLEKYVTWGAEVRSYVLEDTADRDSAVTELARYVISVGLPDRVSSLVSVIADELIANALYCAPVDDKGLRFRTAEPRDISRVLSGRDVVTLRWATDARYLAVEVRDRWGSFDGSGLAAKLASTGKQSTTARDSGMGLPLAYACCNQFVLGLAPTKLTEVIALLDVRYKPTELNRAASFHIFHGSAP